MVCVNSVSYTHLLFEYMASEKPILCNLPVNYDLIREKKLGIAKRFANGKEYAEEITKFRQLTSEEYEMCIRDSI